MILVTGTPGNIGTPLAQQLVEQGGKIRLMVRNPKKQDQVLADLQALGADLVQGDFSDPRSLRSCFAGVESAFLLVPVALETSEWKTNFVRAAKENGVERIVNLSVSGASQTAPIGLFQWHWQAEQELESSGIAWTHLQPTDLARFNIRSNLPTIQAQSAFYSTIGEGRVAMVDEDDVANVAAKVASTGNEQILLCERGAMFGYNTLTVDMRALPIMARTGYPVVFDATHAVAEPGGLGDRSGGQREFGPVLARAAAAVGVAAMFLETHPDPDRTTGAEGPTMLPLKVLPELIQTLIELDRIAKSRPLLS